MGCKMYVVNVIVVNQECTTLTIETNTLKPFILTEKNTLLGQKRWSKKLNQKDVSVVEKPNIAV